MKNKKSKDLLEGRTPEWDKNDWQGRSKEQVESNYKIMDIIFKLLLIFFTIGIVYNMISGL